ncbi:MAG: hypothetical protein ABW088_12210, partial [Sedimenticola sp.]
IASKRKGGNGCSELSNNVHRCVYRVTSGKLATQTITLNFLEVIKENSAQELFSFGCAKEITLRILPGRLIRA